MKGWTKTLITILLVLFTLTSCGGGGDNGTGLPGDKPKVTTQEVDSLSISGATLHGTITSAATATVEFEVDDDPNFGSPEIASVPGTFTGTNQPVSANWAGGLPGKTYHDRLKATNKHGTAFDNGVTFKTYAVVVTNAADNIVDNNVTLNGIVSSMEPVPVEFRWGSNSTLATYNTVSAGTVSGLNQAVSANIQTPNPGTWYFQMVADTGAREQRGVIVSFTTLPSVGSFTGTISNLSSYLFFNTNNELKGRVDNPSAAPTSFYLTLPVGGYKIVPITYVGNRLERAWTMLDESGNNVFYLGGGGNISIGGLASYSSANGTMTFNITGHIPSYEAPINVAGNWRIRRVCTASNNNNVPVGAINEVITTFAQSVSRLEYTNTILGPIVGTINGSLIVMSWYGYQDSWITTFYEKMAVDSTGAYTVGENRQTWNGTTYVDATSEAWKQ